MGKSINKIIIVTGIGIVVLAAPAHTGRNADRVNSDPHFVDVGIIALIESGNFNYAYNAIEQACGPHQIRQCVIDDYNTKGPGRARPLALSDMYDDFLSEHVADWYINVQIPKYIRHYKIKDHVNARIVAYNAGIKALKDRRIPPITRAYMAVYHDILNNRDTE